MGFRTLTAALMLALITPLAAHAGSEDEIKISVRTVGPAPTKIVHRQRVEVVELRGDPNFLDRQFLEIEKRDNQRLAERANREPAAVQGLKVKKSAVRTVASTQAKKKKVSNKRPSTRIAANERNNI